MNEVVRIPLADIKVDETIQCRVALNLNTVEDYANDLRRGHIFPPVIIFRDPETGILRLADGFHRYQAHLEAGYEDIEADVRQGSYRDALWYAIGANRKNPERLSNDDKRKIVLILLNDSEWRRMTDTALAEVAGVSQPWFSRMRRDYESQTGIRTPVRTTRAGHTLDTTNLGRSTRVPLKNAVEFVWDAVAKKDYVPALTKFQIRDGRILAYNGGLALSSPIDLDVDCIVDAGRLRDPLKQYGEPDSVQIDGKGGLVLRWGTSEAVVPTWNGDFPSVAPEGDEIDVPVDFFETLRTLQPFISEDASKPWSRGILFREDHAYATNSVVLIERRLAAPFPVPVNIPEWAVEQVVGRIKETPAKIQIGQSITLHFGERWLRCQLLTTEWPDVGSRLSDGGRALTPVPEGFFEALERLKRFTDDFHRVFFLGEGAISTSSSLAFGVRVQERVAGVGEWGCFDVNKLRLLNGVAQSFDLSAYPDPCPFSDGNAIRGVIVGIVGYELPASPLPDPPPQPSPPPPPTPALDRLAEEFGLPPWRSASGTVSIGEKDAQRILDRLGVKLGDAGPHETN